MLVTWSKFLSDLEIVDPCDIRGHLRPFFKKKWQQYFYMFTLILDKNTFWLGKPQMEIFIRQQKPIIENILIILPLLVYFPLCLWPQL